jgi:hypothetical protein
MGQGCSNSLFSCTDCNFINSEELISENSLKIDTKRYNHSIKDVRKDPIVHCIENMDSQIAMYEKEFQDARNEIKAKQKSLTLDDSFKLAYSPKPKIISSNASEKSVNIIDKISRSTDTDKSFSSSNHN